MEMEEEFKSRVVGVDLSSDRTTYAIVDIRGRIIASSYFETDKYPDINDYVSKLTDEIINLVEANGGYGIIRSVGISVPSACDILGRMVSPPNLPWKGNIPLAAMMRDRMGLAVALGNDAYVAGFRRTGVWLCPRYEELYCGGIEPPEQAAASSPTVMPIWDLKVSPASWAMFVLRTKDAFVAVAPEVVWRPIQEPRASSIPLKN